MNKLRELNSAWESRTPAASYQRLLWLLENADTLADMIDAAQSQHAECKVLRCDVCAALVELRAKEPAPQQMPVTSLAEQRSDSEVGSLSAAESGPGQHAASLAAVARHKGETPETDTLVPHLNLSHYGMNDAAYKLRTKCKDLEPQRDELRAESQRLRSACQEMNAALSRCAYLSGEPNEQECSWYDVEPYPQKAVEAVQKMREELVKLRAQIAGMK